MRWSPRHTRTGNPKRGRPAAGRGAASLHYCGCPAAGHDAAPCATASPAY